MFAYIKVVLALKEVYPALKQSRSALKEVYPALKQSHSALKASRHSCPNSKLSRPKHTIRRLKTCPFAKIRPLLPNQTYRHSHIIDMKRW